MARDVKRRPYDTTTRRARSAQTRQRILASARELMLSDGYRATTIAAVAAHAGVNPDTVYQLIGRKSSILRELIEQAISGTDQPVTAEERDYVRDIRAESDPARKLTLYAAAVRQIQERMAPLFTAVREAAPAEPEVAELWREIAARRAANMRAFVRDIHDAGGLRADLSIEEAADVVWSLNSSEIFLLLTVERAWSPEHFEAWLADAWQRLLLR